jgi:hypothetical protein
VNSGEKYIVDRSAMASVAIYFGCPSAGEGGGGGGVNLLILWEKKLDGKMNATHGSTTVHIPEISSKLRPDQVRCTRLLK